MSVMNKPELVAKLAEKTGESKASAERFLAALQDTVEEAVVNKVEVKISGFVAFTPIVRSERKTISPISGEEILVPERNAVKVRIFKHFRDVVAGETESE